ncbi:HAD domain-containing protein [Catellatospora aurea]|uniref:HAD domain-containing protein n=1 Tax=Catellatospora aurea TaxID=1337874 RepID=A0ABW2H5S4_9ACTN
MTGSTDRPLLFLDVDGPLIPFGIPVPAATTEPPLDDAHPLLARLDPGHGRLLAALPCDLVWATTWLDDANEVIAPRLGLPRLPVVDWPDDEDDSPGRVHWKTRGLVAWAAGRAFVWVDDELTDHDRDWVAAHHEGRALLHRVDPRRGLEAADFAAIRDWLAALER